VFAIGDQRVGIKWPGGPVLDEHGDPTYTEYGEPIIADPAVVWVNGACFEIQTPSEQQNLTVTTSEIGWAFLPVADGHVPAVDDDGEPAPAAVTALTSSLTLQYDGRDYVMRGDAVLEKDIRGRHDHVFCVCEREQG
jgi:hypothetical protein